MKLLVEMPLESAPEGVIFSAAEEPIRLSPFGEWSLVTWRHGICWEWCVCNEENRKVLEHPTIFTSCIKAGDGSWRDFTLEFDVRQLLPLGDTSMDEMFNTCGRAGVFFRYVSYRQTYALFLECQNRIVLYRRDDDKWISLASHEIEIDRDRYYQFKVECKGDNIHCWMDGEPLFDVTDSALPRGRVALYANTVARFGFCRVTTDNAGVAEIANYVSSERLAAAKSAEGLCKPKLWKRISHPPRLPGGGKLALDISPGGKLCGAVLITTDHRFAPRDGAALVAVDVEGNVLWSCEVLKDAHVRVWNIDGDGEQDVLLFDGPKIKLLDIHSGGIKLERPAPPCNEMGNRGGRENETPYMPAYKVYPANIRGLGPGRDIVVLDIHTAFWVLNDKLELLWWRSREHGHDLGVCDIDGDGLDEILCGYVMFDHDGRELWTAEGTEYLVFTHDHVDHIIIDEFDGNLENGMEIAITAGNSGFILFDQNGKRRAQSLMGHAQGLCAGRYRPDLPGKQFLVGCLWGNTGTRSLFSGNGEKLWTIEPDVTGAYDKKLRWAAGRDVFLVNSSVSAAGLYDGYGRRIIPFPEASELSAIDRTFWAQDFTGNGLDDFVIQGEDALFIYTQGDAI